MVRSSLVEHRGSGAGSAGRATFSCAPERRSVCRRRRWRIGDAVYRYSGGDVVPTSRERALALAEVVLRHLVAAGFVISAPVPDLLDGP